MAEFSSEHDLRVEVLAIHGADFYNWHWCVSKPGYQTYEAELDDPNPTITLQRGPSSKCASFDVWWQELPSSTDHTHPRLKRGLASS